MGSAEILQWRREGCAEEASDADDGDGIVSLVRRAGCRHDNAF